MVLFERRLTPSEVDLLRKICKQGGEPLIHRKPGLRLDTLIECLQFDRKEYQHYHVKIPPSEQSALKALQDLSSLLKGSIRSVPAQTLEVCLKSAQEDGYISDGVINEFDTPIPVLVTLKLFHRMLNGTDKLSAAQLREAVAPRYHIPSGFGYSALKTDRLMRGLQGLLSLIFERYHAPFRYLWMPQHVKENVVTPALEDDRSTIVVDVNQDPYETLLKHVLRGSVELRRRYGNGYRPQFNRPELCSALDSDLLTPDAFLAFMKPLEGVLGRIQQSATFDTAHGHCVRYDKRYWFLPLKHQRILNERGL
ncbi:MAG TPA: hypothetical protein VJG90_05655 [Candidatus Nanoarchaeia archaeon]|nr:hypothetical protein [Candidatus Nanoarchaeia archaeon]